jgi:hyperosmotically inducible periplasmic protein
MRSELCSLVLGASVLGLLACPDRRPAPGMQADAPGVTAMDQSNAAADVEVTRSIRQSIAGSESMSINARNVKVITESGVVTLRGPVDGELEKEAIVSIAMRTPGVTRVDDQLEVAR